MCVCVCVKVRHVLAIVYYISFDFLLVLYFNNACYIYYNNVINIRMVCIYEIKHETKYYFTTKNLIIYYCMSQKVINKMMLVYSDLELDHNKNFFLF